MDKIIKSLNDIGYRVLFYDHIILVSSLFADTEIYFKIVDKEFSVVNFNVRHISKFDIRLLPLLNSLLLKFCEIKHLNIFSEVLFCEKN